MADNKQIRELAEILHGTTPATNVKMTDNIMLQHEDLSGNANTLNRFSVGQVMCEPIAVTPNTTPNNGAYTATCSNFPDFAISYTDKNSNTHSLIGMKVRVIFTTGITYGSTTANPPTYPTLNINGTGALPLLAQGMTMGAGSASSGQSLELTLIPYGNSLAWDADTNVREKSSTETVYVDGTNRINTVTSGSTNMVTSGAVDTAIKDGDKVLLCSGDSSTDTFDIDNLPIDGIRHYRKKNYPAIPWEDNNGVIINIPWTNSNWGMQIACDDESNLVALRSKNNNVWNNWERLLKASEMGGSSYYDEWYSSNNYNDGYLLISEVSWSDSRYNQDVGFSGKIYISEASIVNIAYFTATYRARGGSYVTSSFTVNPLGGNDITNDIKCTISNINGDISIRLYYKIKSYYTRVGVLFDGLYAGDVMIRREPTNSHVSFPFTVSNTMTGDVVTVKKMPLGNVSDATTIVDDTDAYITFCSYGKVGIFSVYAKKSTTKQIDISNLGVKVFGQGYKQTMSWSASSISGECWVSSTSALSLDTNGQCSCSLTVFLR